MMRKSGRAAPSAGWSIRTTTPPAEVSRLARARDTLGGLRIEVGSAFDELADHRVLRVLDFVHGPDRAHSAIKEHGDAGADPIRTSHVVRDDDARHAESVAHADHELVDDGARDGVEAGRWLIVQE